MWIDSDTDADGSVFKYYYKGYFLKNKFNRFLGFSENDFQKIFTFSESLAFL